MAIQRAGDYWDSDIGNLEEFKNRVFLFFVTIFDIF
jgi:hypothetical protein